MLADGIEAKVRAASAHGMMSEKKLAEMVNSLIRDRLDEGQLDECDLTLRELNIAAKSFVEFLKGMYHNRIDYPTGATAKRDRKTARADAHKH
jgi:membrane-associated HD superfamily phosphohydrolase